jgi:hypothetical protein
MNKSFVRTVRGQGNGDAGPVRASAVGAGAVRTGTGGDEDDG